MPPVNSMTRFDVTRPAARYRLFVRAFGVGCAAFAILMGGAVGWGAWKEILNGTLAGLNLVGLVLIGFVLAMFGWIGVMLAPAFVSFVDVDGEGVRFTSGSGRGWSQTWGSPTFRLILDRTDGIRDPISKGEPAWTATVGRLSYRGLLTKEAFDAICETALRQGLTITQSQSPRRGWTRLTVTRP